MKGMYPMTQESQHLAIGVLLTLAFGLGLLATYGLTSKSYLENFIVFQVSSDQVLVPKEQSSMNVTLSSTGQSGVKQASLPTSMPIPHQNEED
jgi:hypothetical protein